MPTFGTAATKNQSLTTKLAAELRKVGLACARCASFRTLFLELGCHRFGCQAQHQVRATPCGLYTARLAERFAQQCVYFARVGLAVACFHHLADEMAEQFFAAASVLFHLRGVGGEHLAH